MRQLTLACFAVILSGCVQKAYDRTVVYELDVSALDGVKTVGIRGDDKPLEWGADVAMTPVVADSLYRVVVTYNTGRLITESKFTVDGTMELDDKPNRRIEFTGGDTTIYRARFDQAP